MVDLYLAEAATTGMTGYPRDSLQQVYFDQVFAIHQVSREDYERNLRILAQDEIRLDAIVEQVIALIDEQNEAVSGKKNIPTTSKD